MRAATKKIEPIAVYRPLRWQLAPLRDKSNSLLLTGSSGGGKSRTAAEKVHAYCKKYPNSMGLMMRKNRNSMTNSTILFFEKTVVGDDPSVRHLPSKMRFEYANGSMLAYGGMADDEQREQIRSIGQGGGLDIAWLEEANRFTENDYNEVLGRMRGTAAWRQIILTTNPDQPQHWIKRRLMDGGEAAVYYSRAADNPHNPPDYLETLNKLTGILGKRLRDGLWVQAEGAVYEEFSDELHVIDPFPIPAEWRRIRAVDFGWTNPFVTQWWAIDPDGRMYLYREIYWTQRLVSAHAKQINLYSLGENIDLTISDHDAEDRATLESEGIYTAPAEKNVSRGIQAVAQRLKVAGDGRPRLFLFRDTLVERDPRLLGIASTLEEFPAYSWPESSDGRPIKETPVKVFDHGMDAMRYAAMALETDGPLLLWGNS